MSYHTMIHTLDLGVLGEVVVKVRYWSTSSELDITELHSCLLTEEGNKQLTDRMATDETLREEVAFYDKHG